MKKIRLINTNKYKIKTFNIIQIILLYKKNSHIFINIPYFLVLFQNPNFNFLREQHMARIAHGKLKIIKPTKNFYFLFVLIYNFRESISQLEYVREQFIVGIASWKSLKNKFQKLEYVPEQYMAGTAPRNTVLIFCIN